MKLYIRSQDKTILLSNPKLTIIPSHDGGYEIYDTSDYYDYNNGFNLIYGFLGYYKTKERALEVLDEIQKILMNNTLESSIAKGYKLDNYVYEMPKE
jgi:hypothetical protein